MKIVTCSITSSRASVIRDRLAAAILLRALAIALSECFISGCPVSQNTSAELCFETKFSTLQPNMNLCGSRKDMTSRIYCKLL